MKILFIDEVHPMLAEKLKDQGHDCVNCTSMNQEEIASLLPDAHGIVIRSRFTMNEEFLERAAQLQFIARSGVGMENVDLAYCKSRGIEAFNAAGGNADAVGEHVIGMLLTLFNKHHTADREVKSGLWRREANRGIELGARTIGIIGFGHTGKSLATKMKGFGCKILAYDKYQPVEMEGIQSASLEEIQAACDVVSFHVPLSEETLHYFDAAFMQTMSKPFYLVNASRGKVVSTEAMVSGLASKKILGICLDVLEQEGSDFNLSDNMDVGLHKILSSDKVLLSPHVAGWTLESYEKLAQVLFDQIVAVD